MTSNALAPVSMSEMQILANAVAGSRLFGITRPEEALSLMAIAQAEGMHPAIAARDYHIIQGRPALKADAMLARFQASGGKIEWHMLDDVTADATFSHPQGGVVRISWTMERAKMAGLGGKDMWKKFPRQMLRSRTVSEGIRTVFPGVLVGMYTPEEVRDFDDDKVTTASKSQVTVQQANQPQFQPVKNKVIDVEVNVIEPEDFTHPCVLTPQTDRNGKTDWADWAARFRKALAGCSSEKEVNHWHDLNKAFITQLQETGAKGAKSAENCRSLIQTRIDEINALEKGESEDVSRALPEYVAPADKEGQ